MKIAFLRYITLSLAIAMQSLLWGQVNPAVVQVSDGGKTPEIFAVAESQFIFEHADTVISVVIVSDTTQWHIKHTDHYYAISPRVFTRSNYVDFDSIVQLRITLKNGSCYTMSAPIKPFGEVKVIAYSTKYDYNTSNELKCDDQVAFGAIWVFPEYVKKTSRVYVIMDMSVEGDGQPLHGFTAWYDAGDRSKLQDLSQYQNFKEVRFKIYRLKTLHNISQNGTRANISLGKGFISEWVLIPPDCN